VFPLPFRGADEADALTAGVHLEDPGNLAHVPDGGLAAVHIAVTFHNGALDALLRQQAVNVDVVVGRALLHHTALAGVAEPARKVRTGSAALSWRDTRRRAFDSEHFRDYREPLRHRRGSAVA